MDLYLILAPVLLIPVVWLLRFIGCSTFGTSTDTAGGTTFSGVSVKRINCGGPTVPADKLKGETLDWEADSATAGTPGAGMVGRQKVTDDNGATRRLDTRPEAWMQHACGLIGSLRTSDAARQLLGGPVPESLCAGAGSP